MKPTTLRKPPRLPKHLPQRVPVSIATGLTAVLAALLTLTLAACGGGGGTAPEQAPAAGNEPALAVSQPGDLVRYVQGRLRARDTQLASTPNVRLVTTGGTVLSQAADAAAPVAARSGTLLQEAGVDEPDLLQSAGSGFYTLHPQIGGGLLRVHTRQADGSLKRAAQLTLPVDTAISVDLKGMVLSSDNRALAVLSQRWLPMSNAEVCAVTCEPLLGLPFAPVWWRSSVTVQRVDIATPESAQLGERIDIDGRLVDSRRIGDALYVVSTHTPRLPSDALPANATASERDAAIARLTTADLLPQVRRNGGAPSALLADTDCWVQPRNATFDVSVVTITVFDLKSATLAPVSRCFVGGSEALYMTPSSLYLATSRTANFPLMASTAGPLRYPNESKTDIHKFSLTNGAVAYRASGEVPGHLGWNTEMKPLRMSEFKGDLRVISFTGSVGWTSGPDAGDVNAPPPSPALLTVLRESTPAVASEKALAVVASLPNANRPAAIGKPGEQLHGVRFMGDRAYVVTFRVIDPLYVLDLADPLDPKVAGSLEVPGFSDQLFALDGGLLLGVGRDVSANGRTAGLKVALFDVADAKAPRLLDSQALGVLGSKSALDSSRHGLNYLMVGKVARLALPVNLATPGSTPGTTDWVHGLQRFEVDTQARTLALRPMTGAANGTPYHPVWNERSLQVGDQLFYLNQTPGQEALQISSW